MKNNFYVFLDIDGVLWDWKFLLSRKEKCKGVITKFNPESIEALNFLTEILSKEYNIKIVLSSSWRANFEKIKNILIENNLHYASVMDKTPSTSPRKLRGREIWAYLKSANYDDEKDDFVIIDDETFDLKSLFPENKIIKTSMLNNCLSINMVKQYLKEKNTNKIFEEIFQ